MVRPILRRTVGRPKLVTDEQIVAAARCCFLERGALVSTEDMARELGLTHTTLFNGSKEALMVTALRPPEKIPWVTALEAGPDSRPIREQLVEHCRVMSGYFHELQAGLAVDTLAATILGALHNSAFTARVCGQATTAAAGERHIDRFIDLLWDGIGAATP